MKIIIKNLQKKIPVHPKRIKSAILKLLSREGAINPAEITVCFTGDKEIRRLNKRYLNKDAATDVLAFSMPGQKNPKNSIFDIIVSADTAIRNSKIFKTSPENELGLYLVHGVLHLLGYDDLTAAEAKLMRRKEKEYADM